MASVDGHLHLSCERSEFEEGETQSEDSSNENVAYSHISLYHMRQKETKETKGGGGGKREEKKLTKQQQQNETKQKKKKKGKI